MGRERGRWPGRAPSTIHAVPSIPPPRPRSPSLGGHLRVGDLGGLLRQAAALGGDQVVVLGHIFIRVVEAAGAGPRRGPRGEADAQRGSPLGAEPSRPPGQAQGPPQSRAEPSPLTRTPLVVRGLSGVPSFSGCSASRHIGAGAEAAAHGRGDIGQNRVTPMGCQPPPSPRPIPRRVHDGGTGTMA